MDLLHDLSQTTFNSILLLVLHQSLLLVIAFEYIFARFSPLFIPKVFVIKNAILIILKYF